MLVAPVVTIDRLDGRGCVASTVLVDGHVVGEVTGGAHLPWEARTAGPLSRARRFPSRDACTDWLVDGAPLPAGLCAELRAVHPHVLCSLDDDHDGGHEWPEPVSAHRGAR